MENGMDEYYVLEGSPLQSSVKHQLWGNKNGILFPEQHTKIDINNSNILIQKGGFVFVDDRFVEPRFGMQNNGTGEGMNTIFAPRSLRSFVTTLELIDATKVIIFATIMSDGNCSYIHLLDKETETGMTGLYAKSPPSLQVENVTELIRDMHLGNPRENILGASSLRFIQENPFDRRL
ncbi:hypothetical protein KBD33_04400 [Candidatus Gracilibacteria bacterium]|nr:hypothetical protein [Candidatus Gracilibacteria bacterium]